MSHKEAPQAASSTPGKEKAAPDTPKQPSAMTSGKSKSRIPFPMAVFTTPYQTLLPSKLDPAAPQILHDVRSRAMKRAWKHLFRASLVSLSCFILILEPASLAVLGNAAFFGCILSVMIPPAMPVLMWIFATVTLIFGMLLGWAWGAAGMAAALAARDKILLASQFQKVQASLAGATNPDALYVAAIFKGQFLDARASVVSGVFFFFGTFALGIMRAKMPKLALSSIFAAIVLDVLVSYGPLFPFAQYTLATTFLIPTSCYAAIALVANLCIFPETLNSSWTTDLTDKFLIPIFQRSELHSKTLQTADPSYDPTPWTTNYAAFTASDAKLIAGLEGLLAGAALMDLEVSRGRMSAKDLKSLLTPLKELTSRAIGLEVFCHLVNARHISQGTVARPSPSFENSTEASDPESFSDPSSIKGSTQRIRDFRSRIIHTEHIHSHNLNSLLPILEESSARLRQTSEDALLETISWLVASNTSRWSRKKSSPDELARFGASIAEFELALEAFRNEGRLALIAPFKEFFDTNGDLQPFSSTDGNPLPFSPSSLFLCFTAQFNLIGYAGSLLRFIKAVFALAEKRDHNRIWAPTGLRKIGNALIRGRDDQRAVLGEQENPDLVEPLSDDQSETLSEGSTKVDEDTEKSKKKPKESLSDRLDPDARPPRNGFQKFTNSIYNFGRWFGTAEAIFATRFAVVSVLIWLPQVFPSSAYFVYREKGLWALIMAQTGLAVFAGDQISQSIQKLIATFMGLVWGMLIWYIGAGSGKGSRPGLGASLYILLIIPLAIRLYGPPQYTPGCIIGSVTVMLVVGYSWDNGHLVVTGIAAIGADLAWRRALLVIIGMTAATIMMLLPKPSSARLLVRKTHATCLDELGRIYTTIIGRWLAEERSLLPERLFSEEAQQSSRASMLALIMKLRGIKVSIAQAGFEVSLRGDWPAQEYSTLLSCQAAVVESLSQLGRALVVLDADWRRILVRETAFLNPNLIADVTSTFYLLSMALRQGSPLPEVTPGPLLDRLLYHESARRQKSSQSTGRETDHEEHHHISGVALGHQLTFQILSDERFVTHATALLALSSILSNLDEMEVVTKRLVGEVKFPGFTGLGEWRGGKMQEV